MKVVAFHTNQFSLRGTEVAMYDYAHYNETLLHNKSIILSPRCNANHVVLAAERFYKRFNVFLYENLDDLERILIENNCNILYIINNAGRYGSYINTWLPKNIKNLKICVHEVFTCKVPFGDVFAAISDTLAQRDGWNIVVPHIVYFENPHKENMRQELGISDTTTVFARFGGLECFDIPETQKWTCEYAQLHPDVVFLFMYTHRFSPKEITNIIYIDGVSNIHDKVKFINTADAMVHARSRGETFGLAVAEFSVLNKPVITPNLNFYERAHLDILGDKGLFYTNREEYFKQLDYVVENREKLPSMDWNAYRDYNPETVMRKFNEVFLS